MVVEEKTLQPRYRKADVIVHTYNTSTCVAKTGRSL